MLFNPHPRQFFAPDAPPFRLTRLPTRARLLAGLGVDFTLALPFDADLAACPAPQFIDMILIDALGISGVSVGHDFHFGKDRRGTPDMLHQRGAEAGFEVFVTPALLQADNQAPYSSSAIRQLLRDGDVRAAAALMGHSWSIEGSVNHGDKRGRTIGFPTANMELGDYLRPAFGVYAVRAEILSGALQGQIHDGVANLGLRPTVGGTAPRLETHLFDFDADLYDHELGVALLDFIRPEQKFDGLDALKAQIARDSQAARDALAAQPIK
jgi:riboflavin kinase/FMN adenylyltransferase